MDARAAARRLVPLVLVAGVATAASAMPPPVVPALTSFGSSMPVAIHDVAFDAAGNLFVSALSGNAGQIFKITPGGATSVYKSYEFFDDARGLAFDAAGGLYVADAGFGRPLTGRILRVTPDGVVTVVAAGLARPTSLAVGADGNVYVTEPLTGAIERVTPAGQVSVFASGFVNAGETLGALAFDGAGDLYAGVGGRIVRVSLNGATVTTVMSGLDEVRGLLPYGGEFFVATYGHHDLRFASPTRGVTRLTSTTLGDPCLDGPIPAGASVSLPAGMRLQNGRVYVADEGCHRVRVFDVALPVPARRATWGALKACYR